MRLIFCCSIFGVLLGAVAAQAIETANACSCLSFNSESKNMSVASISFLGSEIDDLDVSSETERWGEEVIARTDGSGTISLSVETEYSSVRIIANEAGVE
jgi:hypothetical protein